MNASASVLILGATSDIGRAIATAYIKRGRPVILTGRSAQRLEAVAEELRAAHGVQCATILCDVCRSGDHAQLMETLAELPGTVVCVVGYAGDQAALQADSASTDLVIRTNFTGPATLLGEFANRMEQRGSGCLVAISSITGERGRAKNYIYGAAKAGFSAFLSGLRQRLYRRGVQVITVKAGYCNTRRTAGRFPPLLTSQPWQVAEAIVAAEAKRRDVIYVLGIWRPIMMIVRLLPEGLFKRIRF